MRFIKIITQKIFITLYLLFFLQINTIKLANNNKFSINLISSAASLDYDQMISVEFEQPEK